MAYEVDQGKLPRYAGSFSFDSRTLQQHIQTTKPDYDTYDPKTWPVVTQQHVRDLLEEDYNGEQILPPYVAYERQLVEVCIGQWPNRVIKVERSDGETTKCGLFFHHFPFIYDHRGRARNSEYMHADHYSSWVSEITGKLPETCTKGNDASPHKLMNPFDEIIEMIHETQAEVMANESEALRQELATIRNSLENQKERADTAEKINFNTKATHENRLADERRRTEALAQSSKTTVEDLKIALREEKTSHGRTQGQLKDARTLLNDANIKLTQETTRANAAEAKANKLQNVVNTRDYEVKAVKHTSQLLHKQLEASTSRQRTARYEVETQSKELDAARNEAAVAKKQINMIRDEMKKVKNAGAQKRQTIGEASGSQAKRAKMEETEE
jgi:hypothetical protein